MGIFARWFVALLIAASLFVTATAPAAAGPARTSPCAEAQALKSLGRVNAAEAAYIRELASPASVGCATKGLTRLGRGDAACAYAKALANDGETENAHAAYMEVLAANPSSACAATGVKDTQPPKKTTSFWTTLGNIAKDVGYVIAAIVLVALLLVAIALVLLQFQTRIPGARDLPPAGKIRRPALKVEALNDDALPDRLGSAIAGLIRGRVTWKKDRFGLNLVSGQAGVATALTAVGDVSAEAKAAVVVINFLTAVLPRRRFQVNGQLQPAGGEGVGISLEFSQNDNAEGLVTFWADSFDLRGPQPSDDYQHLAVAAAAWVDISMAKALDGEDLLTGDPLSWAFFRCGVDAQRLGDLVRARVLYEQARAADGTNVGALANLGIIARREGRYEDAEEYLTRAREAADANAPKLAQAHNPDCYRIQYQFAALFTNRAAVTKPGKRKTDLERSAAREATALAQLTLNTLDQISKRKMPRPKGTPKTYLNETLKPFLEGTIVPSVLVLLAGTVDPLPPRTAAASRPEFEDVRVAINSASIDPWQLISYVELGSDRPPATLFNLACFYTRAGDLGKASKLLQAAVRETQRQERKALVDVALTDPVLKPLRDKRDGIEAILSDLLDPVPPVENAEEKKQRFHRQDRTLNHFKLEGWEVAWHIATSDFDLHASRDSEWLMLRVAGKDVVTEENVKAAIGAVANLRSDNPRITSISAWIVVPVDAEKPTANLTDAKKRGVRVVQETDDGFTPVD